MVETLDRVTSDMRRIAAAVGQHARHDRFRPDPVFRDEAAKAGFKKSQTLCDEIHISIIMDKWTAIQL